MGKDAAGLPSSAQVKFANGRATAAAVHDDNDDEAVRYSVRLGGGFISEIEFRRRLGEAGREDASLLAGGWWSLLTGGGLYLL